MHFAQSRSSRLRDAERSQSAEPVQQPSQFPASVHGPTLICIARKKSRLPSVFHQISFPRSTWRADSLRRPRQVRLQPTRDFALLGLQFFQHVLRGRQCATRTLLYLTSAAHLLVYDCLRMDLLVLRETVCFRVV